MLDWFPLDPFIDLGTRHAYSLNPLYGTFIMLGWNVWRWEKRHAGDASVRRRLDAVEAATGIIKQPMFPLAKRQVGGYRFGVPTWYSLHHLGVDYAASFDPLYAPFDGTIIYEGYGPQGGNMVYFRPDHENVVIRFLHLSRYVAPIGRVSKGQQIAVTGNSGNLSTGPHLHLDINVNPQALLAGNLDFKNFIDPEKYAWEGPPVIVPVQGEEGATAKTYAPFLTDLHFKDSYDPEVARIQSFLIEKGCMPREDLDWNGQVGAASGWYGKKTSTAIDRFQKANGIVADKDHFGWWYPLTRAAANNQLTIN